MVSTQAGALGVCVYASLTAHAQYGLQYTATFHFPK